MHNQFLVKTEMQQKIMSTMLVLGMMCFKVSHRFENDLNSCDWEPLHSNVLNIIMLKYINHHQPIFSINFTTDITRGSLAKKKDNVFT